MEFDNIHDNSKESSVRRVRLFTETLKLAIVRITAVDRQALVALPVPYLVELQPLIANSCFSNVNQSIHYSCDDLYTSESWKTIGH